MTSTAFDTDYGQTQNDHSFASQVDPDLNAFGRLFAFCKWYLNNAKIKVVGWVVTAMLITVLAVAVIGGGMVALKVGEIQNFWHKFDVGTNSIYDLGRKLEADVGSESLLADAARLSIEQTPETTRNLRDRVSEIRGLITSIREAGPTETEEQALALIEGSISRIARHTGGNSGTLTKQEADKLLAVIITEDQTLDRGLHELAEDLGRKLADGGRDVNDALGSMVVSISTQVGVNGVLLVLLAVFFYWFTTIRLVGPLNALGNVMECLAGGQKRINVPYQQKSDEIGDMARTVEIFKQNALKIDQMAREQKEAEAKAERERKQAILNLADSFEEQIKGVVKSVADAAENLGDLSTQLADHVNKQEKSTDSAANASEVTVEKAEIVAAAATELSSAITEIMHRVSNSIEVAEGAATEANSAQGVMNQLSDASNHIGEVVEMINEIAAKIELLALNATIEAQRAGEAGRGFAVVANEVKDLSLKTRKATEDITDHVDSIKSVSDEAVTSIGRISNVIEQINMYSTEISSAVTEQQTSTEEISRSIEHLVEESNVVKGVIGEVVNFGKETAHAASGVNDASELLKGDSQNLSEKVDGFLKQVREG